MKIRQIYVESQVTPLGLDEKKPSISWIYEPGCGTGKQKRCRIKVGRKTNAGDFWDSGWLETSESRGIIYEGKELEAETRYEITVETCDENQEESKAETWFETGIMNPSVAAWDGAEWIGAPRYTVCAENRGIFILESTFRLEEGSTRAGLVFGARDERLLDARLNELGIEGENYIRFELDNREKIPVLSIYRVGYAPEDSAAVPFAVVPLKDFESGTPVITSENVHAFHDWRIEVDGNNTYTYIDGILVDAVRENWMGHERVVGRQLNPRGFNDVITYPRLNEIGFFAGEGSQAAFRNLTVRNMRAPSAAFVDETPMGGLNGRESLFSELPVKADCFWVDGGTKKDGLQMTKDPSNTSIPMLRTVIHTDPGKVLASARIYMTARGIYECRVNGEEITSWKLTPGLTQYDKRLMYQTYDVTDRIKEGANGIGVTLASGWWSDAQTFVLRNYNFFGDRESLLGRIVLTYADGSRSVFVTNTKDWQYYGEGPYTYAGNFYGEHLDGRKLDLYESYSRPEFDASAWEAPVVIKAEPIAEFALMPFGAPWPAVNGQEPELTGGYFAPVRMVADVTAKKVWEQEPGVWMYDLEQEMAGVPSIVFHEKAGTRILIRFGEVLYPNLEEYGRNQGKLLLENYRDATSTDVYICRGEKGGETYQPRFTFHGYRYIQIIGAENPPKKEEVISHQYSSIESFEGSFECSNPLVNRFVENVKWSQLSNFINIPTDCPQRNERMGWAGDTHVFCATAIRNGDLKLFYERNLQAMADLQREDGRFPEIAPVGGGFGGITYESASIYILWELYQQYGDVRSIRRFYPGLERFMTLLKNVSGMPGPADFAAVGPLGDWLAPKNTDVMLLWNAFYYRNADTMVKFSEVIGETEKAEKYRALAEEIKTYWNQVFVDPETKKTRSLDGSLCDTQCSYAIGLNYGVMEDRKAAGEHLARTTKESGHTIGTGFFGTGIISQALTDTGHAEDAFALMTQTAYPSWLYPVTQGATSIWERWDSCTEEKGFGGNNSMNSFNHYSLGSVLNWLYTSVLGIQKEEAYPGYEHFILKPYALEFEYAKGSAATPYGTIFAEWKKTEAGTEYTVTIPMNTSASFQAADGSWEELGSGTHTRLIS